MDGLIDWLSEQKGLLTHRDIGNSEDILMTGGWKRGGGDHKHAPDERVEFGAGARSRGRREKARSGRWRWLWLRREREGGEEGRRRWAEIYWAGPLILSASGESHGVFAAGACPYLPRAWKCRLATALLWALFRFKFRWCVILPPTVEI
jgi:hypothetical protein